MKPLYIEASPAAAVMLDGNALHICRAERAPIVIGLRNISQIITATRTRFTPAALESCMRRGISVIFLDSAGQVQGFLHGNSSKRSQLPARLAELFELPDGEWIYRTWWKAMVSRQRCKIARRLRIPPDCHRTRTLNAMLKQARRQRAPEALVEALQRRWHSGVIAVAQQVAQDEGFTAAWQRCIWPRCNLVADLASLIEWELLLPSLSELSRLHRAQQDGASEAWLRARILERFEAHRPELRAYAMKLMYRLDMRLMELGLV